MTEYRIYGYRSAGNLGYTYTIERREDETSAWIPTIPCFTNLDDAKRKVRELKEYPEDKVYIYV